MTTSINKDDVFIVCPGRSVLTARRGMAHAGGRITLEDIRTGDPAKVMAGYLDSGKVEVDKEAAAAREAAAVAEQERIDKAVAEGKERAALAAEEAAKGSNEPPTEAEIVEAIGKLEEGNTEHWTNGGSPQVAALEGLLGKQISAADRDAAWAKVNESA